MNQWCQQAILLAVFTLKNLGLCSKSVLMIGLHPEIHKGYVASSDFERNVVGRNSKLSIF